MKILTKWLRAYLPGLPVADAQLAEDLTLRGIAAKASTHSARERLSVRDGHHTNRVDAMNITGWRGRRRQFTVWSCRARSRAAEARSTDKPFRVRIEAEDACGRFTRGCCAASR